MADKRIIDLTAETALTRTDTFFESDHATRGSEKVSVENVLLRDQNNQTGVAYTLVLTDSQKRLTMSNGSSNAITVPPNASVAFPINTVIPILQLGAGQTSLVAGSGVTLNSLTSSLLIPGQYAQSILIKTATNVWSLTNAKTNTTSGAFTTLTASGDVNFDSGTFFTDVSENKIGIGTTAPEHKLSVFEINNANRTEIGIDNQDQRLVFGAFFEAGQLQYGTIQSTNNAESGASPLLLQPDGGNVGIGTNTTPSRPLTLTGDAEINVSGASNSSKAIVINSSGNAFESDAGLIQGTHAGSGAVTGGYWLKFKANNADKFLVRGDGKVNSGAAASFGASLGQFNGVNVATLNTAGQFSIGSTDTAAANLGGSLGFTANTTSNAGYPMGSISGRLIAAGANVYRSYMAFATTAVNGTVAERMRLTDTGLGIGTASPGTILDINDDASTGTGLRVTGGGSGGPLATFTRDVGSTGSVMISSSGGDPQMRFTSANDNWSIGLDSTVFNICDGSAVGSNQRLVIDTSGNVGIGTTSLSGLLTVGNGHIYQNKTGGDFPGISSTTSHGFMAESQGNNGTSIHVSRVDGVAGNFARQGTGDVVVFRNTSGSVTEAGSIEITGAASVLYQTSSDYRLKENVVDVLDGIDRVKQLNPVRFNFIGEDPVVDGFLAHEVQDVVPEAIGGEKDGMKDEEYESSPAVYEDVVHPAVDAAYKDVVHPATYVERVDPAVEATYDEDGNELTPAVDEHTEQVLLTEEYTEQVLVTEAQEEYTESVLVTEAVMGNRTVPKYQGIDQSKLVPLLTAALQEAVAKIEALEARVATLEG